MNDINDIVIILDSILDDYYYLWECYSEFSDFKLKLNQSTSTFSDALISAYELGFIGFYKGTDFTGEEVLITNFELTKPIIQELLDWKGDKNFDIRLTTSLKGVECLNSGISST